MSRTRFRLIRPGDKDSMKNNAMTGTMKMSTSTLIHAAQAESHSSSAIYMISFNSMKAIHAVDRNNIMNRPFRLLRGNSRTARIRKNREAIP